MSSAVARTFAILELLGTRPEGMPVTAIAAHLDMPASGAHRLLNQLVRSGHVRQDRAQGDYGLTMKMAALGLSFLRRSGVTDIAQPGLDALALESRELVRMAVVDAGRLVFVAVAQGATSGLRYDPDEDQGVEVHLASSASGLAWLATLSDAEALLTVARQGFRTDTSGPNAAAGAAGLLALLAETRARGFSVMFETFLAGMSSMAAVLRHPQTGEVIGTLSIAGPSSRLSCANMLGLGGALIAAAEDIGRNAEASTFFRRQSGAATSDRTDHRRKECVS